MAKKKRTSSTATPNQALLHAIDDGDLDKSWQAIESGADLSGLDAEGLTPLHRVVANSRLEISELCELIEMLIMGGNADPNAETTDGRTVLFVAAEHQTQAEPIQALLTFGATADASNAQGVHVTDVSSPAIRKLVKTSINNRVGSGKKRKTQTLTKSKWSSARRKITKVFKVLEEQNLVCLHSAGYTQSDGFEECDKVVASRGGLRKSKVAGYCYYTEQDRESALATGSVSLSFWGAPRGSKTATIKIGKLIVTAFSDAGFAVEWDGTIETRPVVVV